MPRGVCTVGDGHGNTIGLLVVDSMNHRVMYFKTGETEGTIVAGGDDQTSSNKQLYKPHAICTEESVEGKTLGLFVADTHNHRVM